MSEGHVLITRPHQDAQPLQDVLEAAGRSVLVAPMFNITLMPKPSMDMEAVTAIALTSANGARALAASNIDRHIPIYAVGEATAKEARSLGYRVAVIAQGNVAYLVDAIKAHHVSGQLIHVVGKHQAGRLAADLNDLGIKTRCEVLYEARAISELSPTIIQALKNQEIAWSVFYSPRTAHIFMRLLEKHALRSYCHKIQAAALSPAVADALCPDNQLFWREIHVASSPLSTQIIDILLP